MKRSRRREVLGIDIGGSSFKAAPVDTATGKLLAEVFTVKIALPLPVARGLAAAREIVDHFAWRGPIGIGFPGIVLGDRLGSVGNLGTGWQGQPAAKKFEAATGRPTRLCNDADAAGLAEVRFGAGRRRRGTVLMLTFGTGIGSALFRDGVLMPNIEFGHIPWPGREPYTPIEQYASARAMTRDKLTWRQWGKRVDEYLHIVERLCSPDWIIVGGGVSAEADKWVKYLHCRAEIVPAKFGNDAGIVGAALAAV